MLFVIKRFSPKRHHENRNELFYAQISLLEISFQETVSLSKMNKKDTLMDPRILKTIKTIKVSSTIVDSYCKIWSLFLEFLGSLRLLFLTWKALNLGHTPSKNRKFITWKMLLFELHNAAVKVVAWSVMGARLHTL